ncbi:MAG: Fe-S cluster assembly ATPase SufC [Candidatus Marinimicrobia bacterium]|nr:Fe-S cluster assembly ATPase SufC [Candidatus Neomarinimicrobiota bacterium]
MLDIKNLHASVEGKEILKGLDLSVKPGELHVIMGPNGAGKSTLANVLAGRDKFEVTEGSMHFNGESLIDMLPENRAGEGMFLSFQYPVAIPGVNNMYFLKAAVNAVRKYRGEDELDAVTFLKMIREKLKVVELDDSFIHRPVNEGFSGGEKKRNEILQMISLQPQLSILDETDSGLDIDALRIVAEGINNYRDNDRAFILITHYQRMLNYMEPDYIHVLMDGKIVKSGPKELAFELEEKGYSWI